VSPGAATEGVTPFFAHHCHFYWFHSGVTPPPAGYHPAPFLPVQPPLSIIVFVYLPTIFLLRVSPSWRVSPGAVRPQWRHWFVGGERSDSTVLWKYTTGLCKIRKYCLTKAVENAPTMGTVQSGCCLSEPVRSYTSCCRMNEFSQSITSDNITRAHYFNETSILLWIPTWHLDNAYPLFQLLDDLLRSIQVLGLYRVELRFGVFQLRLEQFALFIALLLQLLTV